VGGEGAGRGLSINYPASSLTSQNLGKLVLAVSPLPVRVYGKRGRGY